jgi:hypothetical protein
MSVKLKHKLTYCMWEFSYRLLALIGFVILHQLPQIIAWRLVQQWETDYLSARLHVSNKMQAK